jgi:hypothetical protein
MPGWELETPHDVAHLVASERYAWPGGYELYAITDDGGALCYGCCATEADVIAESNPGDGWHAVAIQSSDWLEEPTTCDHCGRSIPKED